MDYGDLIDTGEAAGIVGYTRRWNALDIIRRHAPAYTEATGRPLAIIRRGRSYWFRRDEVVAFGRWLGENGRMRKPVSLRQQTAAEVQRNKRIALIRRVRYALAAAESA
jgi:hypothetical protein